jgi:nucleoside-diphosphate-sugar epimerase
VRTTVRSLERETGVQSVLTDAGMVNGHNLSFVAADLTSDVGWADAVADADFVLHVASPVQPGHVDNEDDLIIPAREGALRVLRAARVTRVVLTSAFHAVSWGHPHNDHTFTEEDWTILDGPGVDAYGQSKTLAERAAWDFIATEGGPLELTTILPVAVMGPVMGDDISGSNHLIQAMLDGEMPGFPHLFIPVVDVRDVANAHILAMKIANAAGQRFLVSSGPAITMKEIGAILKANLGEAATRVPTRSIPNIVVRIAALFSAEFRPTVPDLDNAKKVSNEKSRRVLGWQPRKSEEAIIAAGESMVRKGLVKK